jgi:hypothetical protein
MPFYFRGQRFFQLRLNIFQWCRRRGRREDALHRLNNSFHIGSALDVFDCLHVGEGDGLHVTERNTGVRGVEYAQLLERHLNCHGEAADLPLVDLGRRVQHHEEGEQQGDEVGVADHTVITEINSQFAVAGDGSGGGPLETDNSLREVQSQLLGALSYSISGNSGVVNLASIGVNFNNDGTLTVNNGKLSSALSSNFSAVQNLLQNSTNGFSQNLSTVLSNINSAGSGILSLDSQSLKNTSQDLSRQVSDLQAALAVQQASLTNIYAQVNTTLQELPLLESQITQQLASVK